MTATAMATRRRAQQRSGRAWARRSTSFGRCWGQTTSWSRSDVLSWRTFGNNDRCARGSWTGSAASRRPPRRSRCGGKSWLRQRSFCAWPATSAAMPSASARLLKGSCCTRGRSRLSSRRSSEEPTLSRDTPDRVCWVFGMRWTACSRWPRGRGRDGHEAACGRGQE